MAQRERLNRTVSLAVIGLFLLPIAVAVAIVSSVGRNPRALNKLPVQSREALPLPANADRVITPPHELRGNCHSCHPLAYGVRQYREIWGELAATPSGAATAFPAAYSVPVQVQLVGGGARVVVQTNLAPILTPKEQNAADKIMVEGHWAGMETIDLIAALRRVYNLPPDILGVMVDEITLESAESGILAGDVITRIGNIPTPDLGAFFQATVAESGRTAAGITVFRQGALQRFTLIAKNTPTLGFAQMEGASPIQPGALSPHRQRRQACTACHVIMKTGGQLPVDAGDILPTPPPIAPNAQAPHANRGACASCHQIGR